MEAKIKVLVADDSVTVQRVFSLVFSDEPVDLTITGDGELALKTALDIRPDIVLADIIMPGLNGYQLCKALKKQLPGTPVVLMTGTFEPFDPDEADKVGADSVIMKPFESEAVIRLVNKLVRGIESARFSLHNQIELRAAALDALHSTPPPPHVSPQPASDSSKRPLTNNHSDDSSKSHLHIFLCHASDDKPTVRELHRRFGAEGFLPWLDEENLLPGEDWRGVIRRQIRASDAVVVCLSSRSTTKTGYVQNEIAFALDILAEQPEGAIFLIPLLLERCEIPDCLAHLHVAQLPLEEGFARVCRSLQTLSKRKIKPQR
jgi:CheY-like chemotaxis protein